MSTGQTNDGGPAFPRTDEIRRDLSGAGEQHRGPSGMSLRDHFAGLALGHIPALIAANQMNPSFCNIAEWAYEMADAMLAAREESAPPRALSISGHQLRDALEFCGGEDDTVIEITNRTAWTTPDGDEMAAGLYAHLAEYPEEGVYGPLSETGEPAVSQWQPIETAPKDRSIMLGSPPRDGCPGRATQGYWQEEVREKSSEYHASTGEYLGQFETGDVTPAFWNSEDGGFTEEYPPTHWMPLPAAPTGKEEA